MIINLPLLRPNEALKEKTVRELDGIRTVSVISVISARLLVAFMALLLTGVVQGAEGEGETERSTGKRINVVTTVAPITNIVRNVAGVYAIVTGIVPDGTDSHTFEPAPGDAKILQAADIIIVNGLDLELPTVKLAEKVKKPGVSILRLGNRALRKEEWRYDFSFPREHGHPNPHLWPNIALAMRYVEITRDALAALDAAHADNYAKKCGSIRGKAGQAGPGDLRMRWHHTSAKSQARHVS